MPVFHKASGIELPVFVAVGAVPLSGLVMRFVGETDGDSVLTEGPQLLDEAVVALGGPLPGKKSNDLRATGEELRAVSPATIHSVAT